MPRDTLTLKSVRARSVVVPLKRPVVSKVGLFRDWPMILIDLYTNEGIVGHSYLEPYLKQAIRYIVPAIEDLADAAKGLPVAPFDGFRRGIGSLHLVGREGVSMIAVSGLDMAAWDAMAKASDMPLAVFLGGTVGPVPAYNSNGLWLTPLETLASEAAALVAEGGFTGLKLRLGRAALADDLAAIAAVREAAGANVKLMCDFNQGLTLGDALVRSHAHRRGERVAARGGNHWRSGHPDVDPSLPGNRRASHAGHRYCTLARMAGLGRSDIGRTVPAQGWSPGHS